MAAHNLSYVAACSAAYPLDLFDKIRKCVDMPGTKYIHIHIPCPPGWDMTRDTESKSAGLPWKQDIMTSTR